MAAARIRPTSSGGSGRAESGPMIRYCGTPPDCALCAIRYRSDVLPVINGCSAPILGTRPSGYVFVTAESRACGRTTAAPLRWAMPSKRPSGSSAALRGWGGFDLSSQRDVRRLCRARLLGSMLFCVVAVAIADAACSATTRDKSGLLAPRFSHRRCSVAASAAVVAVVPVPLAEVVAEF